jgi:hypothetical protein
LKYQGEQMGKGLFVDGDWAYVDYNGRAIVPIPKGMYEARRFSPSFEILPTKEQYQGPTRGCQSQRGNRRQSDVVSLG